MSSKILLYFFLFFFFSGINNQRNLKEEGELSDDIIILHTNDVHCAINNTIGYDGLNLYRKELLTKYKNVLLVDAGDHIQGGVIGLLTKGKDIINITNYLDYDVVTIGNHEFDYKIEQLKSLSNMIDARYICANFLYRKNRTTIFDPYKIVQVGDISIGFIGVITPQTLTKSYLHTLVDEDGNLIYDFLTENEGRDLYSTIQGYIDELRDKHNVTYVIILSHMGYGGDALPQYTSPALLANIRGVDAIIDGHTHLVYNSTFKDKDGKEVYISQTGTKLKNVGKLTIKANGAITSELIDQIPLFEGYEPYSTVERGGIERYVDPDTNSFLEEIIESHAHEFEEVIGKTDFDLYITTPEGERISHFEENPLCNLIVDAFRYYGKSDISIINAGSVRSSLLKGKITYNNVLDILPFSAKIIIKEVLGIDILNSLELSVRLLPGKTSKFLQVSGIKFKVDESITSPVVLDENENFVRVDGERRVYDVYIGDNKIDLDKKYTITFDEFVSEGGDGFSMFAKYNITNDTYLEDNEIFKLYLENELNRNIPDIYNKTQGRIVKEKKPEKSDDIVILHTNDIHAGIDNNIGFDGLNLYRKELLIKYKHVLLVDAGDHIQGAAIGSLTHGEDIIDIMNYLKYDVVTIGNHDFDYGIDKLLKLNEKINSKFICANLLYRKTKSTVFDPYKIIKARNFTIGFIGVITPQTLIKSYLHTVVDENGNLTYDLLTENEGRDLYNTIQGYINELRNEKKVDYVIILSHIGYGGDGLEQFTSPALLANISGVDAIIDGHSHLVYNSTHKDKEGKEIYISQTGTKLKNVGKLTIKTNGTITSEIIDQIPLFDDYFDNFTIVNRNGIERYVDKDTNKILEDLFESHSDLLKEIIGKTNFDLDITTERGPIYLSEEIPLGDLIVDSYRYYGQSDISLINAGFIKESIKKGNITSKNILDLLPSSERILVKEVTGKDILDALEFGVRALPKISPRFLQVSGIKFKVDENIKSPIIVDNIDNFVKVEGERRIYDVYIGDNKLDENKKYKITFDEFLAEGGDGFTMFSKYNITNDTFFEDNEVFKLYLVNVLKRTIPDIYNKTQERIVKEKKKEPIPTDNSNYFIKYLNEFSLILLSLMLFN